MTTEFEQLLHNRGFILQGEIIKLCNHDIIDKSYIWYVQECSCCMGTSWAEEHNRTAYLEWSKRICCENCLKGNISCLACGGHYNNIRIFKVDNNSTCLYNKHNLIYSEPDPDQIISDLDVLESGSDIKEDVFEP